MFSFLFLPFNCSFLLFFYCSFSVFEVKCVSHSTTAPATVQHIDNNDMNINLNNFYARSLETHKYNVYCRVESKNEWNGIKFKRVYQKLNTSKSHTHAHIIVGVREMNILGERDITFGTFYFCYLFCCCCCSFSFVTTGLFSSLVTVLPRFPFIVCVNHPSHYSLYHLPCFGFTYIKTLLFICFANKVLYLSLALSHWWQSALLMLIHWNDNVSVLVTAFFFAFPCCLWMLSHCFYHCCYYSYICAVVKSVLPRRFSYVIFKDYGIIKENPKRLTPSSSSSFVFWSSFQMFLLVVVVVVVVHAFYFIILLILFVFYFMFVLLCIHFCSIYKIQCDSVFFFVSAPPTPSTPRPTPANRQPSPPFIHFQQFSHSLFHFIISCVFFFNTSTSTQH